MVHEVLGASRNSDIISLMDDGDLLRKMHSQVLDDAHSHHHLLKLGWETLLVSFAAYLEYNYFHAPTDELFENRRLNLLPVLQRVAQEKVGHFPVRWGGGRALNRALEMVRSRLLRGKPLDAYALFDAWDAVLEVEHIIENYCFKGWGIRLDEGIAIHPKAIELWDDWTVTNHKFQVIDLFYQTIPFLSFQEQVEDIFQNSPNEDSAMSLVSALGGNAFLMDMLGTLDVFVDGAEVDLGEVVNIMKIFDTCYKGNYLPYMAQMKDEGCRYSEAIIETEKDQIGRNLRECVRRGENPILRQREIMKQVHLPCIFSRTRDEMLLMMTQYDPIEPDSARLKACDVALNLFSGPPHMKSVDNGQFLRAPDKSYIVMPRFFHGDVKTALFNILIRRKRNHRLFSSEMEKSLEWMFREQGYTTVLDWKYPAGDTFRNGEVDVLAYKDGFLFVVEAKLTYFRTQAASIYEHRDKLCDGGGQLKRAMQAISNNYSNLREALGIEEDYGSVKIVPLLVSCSPEFDNEQFSQINKVSLFEMKGLLDSEMFVLVQALIAMYNNATVLGMTTNRSQQEHIRTTNFNPDSFLLEMDRSQEQYGLKAALIASQPDELVEAIKSKTFWERLGNNPDVVRGPIEKILTLKNGDEIRYVI